jgi:hypothetical protein
MPGLMNNGLSTSVSLTRTPNAIAQLCKYFWAVLSFDGAPSSDDFTKHYGLHYQTEKVVMDSFEKYQQFDIINFHTK